ncbi:unnamed protein product [Linum tenue]|uniref:F-box domain-containing protein n=1 Tax=Linum tenue TaxID=586396 RepID=A0AAV0K7U3_9ROSI|nr:unnamed protein product [Linum tenue]
MARRHPTAARRPPKKSQLPSHINNLDDDLILEILTRLPNPRSVFRCRSVCKRWNSLISAPPFRPEFLRRIATRGGEDEFPLVFPQSQPETLDFLPIPADYRHQFRVLASCDDLILCGLATHDVAVGNLFYVGNPFTNQWVILPLAPYTGRTEPLHSDDRIMVGFVCQPCYSYCDFKDQVLIDSQFKFRVVLLYKTGGDYRCEVFCSELGRWVDRVDNFEVGYEHYVTPGYHITLPCFNGKLYWKCEDSRELVGYDPFDINGEPETIDYYSEFYSRSPQLVSLLDIEVSQGALHLIVLEDAAEDDFSIDGLSVWSLDDSKTWQLENRVSLKSIWARFEFPKKTSRRGLMNGLEVKGILGIHPSKPEIVYLAYGNFGACYAVSCNLKSEELELCGGLPVESTFRWNVFQPEVRFWPTPIPVPTYDRVGFFSDEDGTTDSVVAHSSLVEPSHSKSRKRKRAAAAPSSVQPKRRCGSSGGRRG